MKASRVNWLGQDKGAGASTDIYPVMQTVYEKSKEGTKCSDRGGKIFTAFSNMLIIFRHF